MYHMIRYRLPAETDVCARLPAEVGWCCQQLRPAVHVCRLTAVYRHDLHTHKSSSATNTFPSTKSSEHREVNGSASGVTEETSLIFKVLSASNVVRLYAYISLLLLLFTLYKEEVMYIGRVAEKWAKGWTTGLRCEDRRRTHQAVHTT